MDFSQHGYPVNDPPYWPILDKLNFFAKDKRSSLFYHAVRDEENI
jgi:hypothetical protein